MTGPDRWERLVEALLFASPAPVEADALRARLPTDIDLDDVLSRLQQRYRDRGVTLNPVAGGWAFRTAPDLADALQLDVPPPRKPSRAALETLAIIAYHQPVTRAEIEQLRGVTVSKGTLDVLLAAGWVRPGRRRQTVGRPLTWVTTPAFLDHFGLASLKDLPGVTELEAAGLLDTTAGVTLLPGGAEHDREDGDGAGDADHDLDPA